MTSNKNKWKHWTCECRWHGHFALSRFLDHNLPMTSAAPLNKRTSSEGRGPGPVWILGFLVRARGSDCHPLPLSSPGSPSRTRLPTTITSCYLWPLTSLLSVELLSYTGYVWTVRSLNVSVSFCLSLAVFSLKYETLSIVDLSCLWIK